MKIHAIESFTDGQRLGLVRVRAEDGSEGWGQFAPSNADITALVLHRQVAPVALGMVLDDPQAVTDAVMLATYKFPGTYVCRALAGLDTAIWDLRGKLAGKSVCELLGARRDPSRFTARPCAATPRQRTKLHVWRTSATVTAFKALR